GPQGLNGLRPQRAAAVNARLWAGVIEPTAVEVEVPQGQAGAVGIPQAAVDPQEQHSPELRAGGVEQGPQLFRREEALALGGPGQPQHLLGGALEPGPVTHWVFEQAGVVPEFEDNADTLDLISQGHRPPLRG